ncbi:hypothetical protein K440DRAFT_626267 [Wilcoxina mikolae CBS 423.85]|nr:hypothetical protein K440DRAFT_626267 [Wilcoxina mikolae CBS 423.85]
MPERAFYRPQILANSELLFPNHSPKLVTTDSGGRRILLVSSTTGQVLHEHNGTSKAEFANLLSRTEKLLAAKVRGGVCGVGTDETEKLRKENEELRMQLAEEKWARKLENMEARLAEEKRMREGLERQIRSRSGGMNTPTTITCDFDFETELVSEGE